MNRLIFPLIALALSFQGASLFAATVPEAVVSLVRAEWPKIFPSDSKGPPFWSHRVSPGFPCSWPVKERGPLCYYAYAAAFDPQLADGERIAAPWARVTVERNNPPKAELLTKAVKELGIQGVRPLKKGETEILKTDSKGFYCLWAGTNGVIAAELRKIHPEFFEWLGCR